MRYFPAGSTVQDTATMDRDARGRAWGIAAAAVPESAAPARTSGSCRQRRSAGSRVATRTMLTTHGRFQSHYKETSVRTALRSRARIGRWSSRRIDFGGSR